MLRAALALSGALMISAHQASAQGAATESRWSLVIRGPVTSERGELRLGAQGGRLLLESSDTAWQPLREFKLVGGRISFTVSGARRFEGELGPSALQGTSTDVEGRPMEWIGERIPPGIVRWPVRPRVQLRQVVIGTAPNQVTLPPGWRAILPSPAVIAAERDTLALAAGFRIPTIEEMLAAHRVPLGFDSAGRVAVQALLLRISRGPAANDGFRRIFETPTGIRADLHQVAFSALSGKRNPIFVDPSSLVRGLAAFSRIAPASGDSLSLYAAAWRVWTQRHTDTTESQMLLDALAQRDADAHRAVRAIISAYDDAVAWWAEAVQWLMQNQWIDTPAGRRSPAELVAAFWGQRELPIPTLEPTHFGSVQAVPVVGAARLGARLIRPLNASAVDWLAQGGLARALIVWRQVENDDSLTVVRDGRAMQLTSPAAVTRSRLGGFLSGRDAIRMEPGISPVFAVVTALHEWQHLLFEGARLEGKAPGFSDTPDELVLHDGNPWLAEGAAEWATEALLAPARASAPLLPYMEALKRSSIDALTGGDDPHALGYLLVRALAGRTSNPAVLRERLIRLLHDPVALGREYRLEGAARGVQSIRLNRPNGAGVIPEIAFTWDGGVAENLSRRLIIPAHPQEH